VARLIQVLIATTGLAAVGLSTWGALRAWHGIETEAEATVYEVQQGAISAQAARFGAHLSLLEATAGQVAARPDDLAAALWSSPSGWDETTGELRIVVFDAKGALRFDSSPDSAGVAIPSESGVHWTRSGDLPVIAATAFMDDGGWVVLHEPAHGFAQLLSSPWSWVVGPDGRILAHADALQVGSTPFSGRELDPRLDAMLTEMRTGGSGSAAYDWHGADGSIDERMATFAPIPGAPAGWSIGTSTSRSEALIGVSNARAQLGLAGLSLLLLSAIAGLSVVLIQREGRRRDRRYAEERLAMTQAAAHGERLAMLGTLTAGVAHDLRGPLTAVRGLSDLLLEAEPDEVDELAQDLDMAIDTLGEMVDDLTSFARTRAETGCYPADALRLTERMLKARFRHEVALMVDTPDLDPVALDRRRLSQALLNLAINAQQAGAGRVHIHAASVENAVQVFVDDDGPGVPLDLRAQLFDAFFTTKADGEGTGLGLHLVQRFLQEVGGEVGIDDSPLGGARFRLTVPCVDCLGETPPMAAAAR